jgi:hypothetical protein
MADKIYTPGTPIRFKGAKKGAVNPIGEIVSRNTDGSYSCKFYGDLTGWNPTLSVGEFTVLSGKRQAF